MPNSPDELGRHLNFSPDARELGQESGTESYLGNPTEGASTLEGPRGSSEVAGQQDWDEGANCAFPVSRRVGDTPCAR